MKHKEFFPDIKIPPAIAEALECGQIVDTSWRNDACPTFVRKEDEKQDSEYLPRLWVDHEEPSLRDLKGNRRFGVSSMDGTYTFYSGDDAYAALETLLSYPVAIKPNSELSGMRADLVSVLGGASNAIRRALPHIQGDHGDAHFCGEWLGDVDEAIAKLVATKTVEVDDIALKEFARACASNPAVAVALERAGITIPYFKPSESHVAELADDPLPTPSGIKSGGLRA